MTYGPGGPDAGNWALAVGAKIAAPATTSTATLKYREAKEVTSR
jgi:hypothetical protein